jgi:aspartyl-tRNA(Asn)/glutamyl-tRNA(Gln) amidotransferase subunit A
MGALDGQPMPSMLEAAAAVREGTLTATELVEACLARIGAGNGSLNAFVHLDPEGALADAARVDEVVAAGDVERLGPLAGVPFGVKDLEDCAGMPTSHGSLLYRGGPPVDHDSEHVRRLRSAGAIPLGKTAAPEFGTLQYTHTLAWGTTRNPWDPTLTPGGSSGGTAAAVAAGMIPFGTASDGGGSTRIPASFSGLVGLKPSHGRIPHPDVDPSETACFGALVTTVADAAAHLDLTAGPHDTDRLSLPSPSVSYVGTTEGLDVSGLRVGWSPDLGFAHVDPEVLELSRAAAEIAAGAAGVELVEVDVRLTDPVATWLSAGAMSLWLGIDAARHWPERAEDLTPFVRMALEATAERPLRTLTRGYHRRLQLQADMAALFEQVDVLMTPTTAVPAFVAEGPPPTEIAGVEVNPAMSVPFTMLANLCWNPAVSVPAGVNSAGLPVGLQVMGRRHHDEVPLRFARLLEQARPWQRHAPGAEPAGVR